VLALMVCLRVLEWYLGNWVTHWIEKRWDFYDGLGFVLA
jgi:hypothetical protein